MLLLSALRHGRVGNGRPYDRLVALQRMQQVGAFLTTAEQIAFQLTVSAEHPK